MKFPSPWRLAWWRTEILASHSSFRREYRVYNRITASGHWALLGGTLPCFLHASFHLVIRTIQTALWSKFNYCSFHRWGHWGSKWVSEQKVYMVGKSKQREPRGKRKTCHKAKSCTTSCSIWRKILSWFMHLIIKEVPTTCLLLPLISSVLLETGYVRKMNEHHKISTWLWHKLFGFSLMLSQETPNLHKPSGACNIPPLPQHRGKRLPALYFKLFLLVT